MKKCIYIFSLLFLSATMLSAQSKFSLGIEGGVKLQTGNLAEVWDSPIRGAVFGTYSISSLFHSNDEIQLILKAGYYQAGVASKFNDTFGSFVKTPVSIDWPLKMIPVTLGAKYFLSDYILRPYITASAGAAFLKLSKVSATYPTGTVTNNSGDVTTTSFLFSGGIGGQLKINSAIYLDLSAQYENIARDIQVPTQPAPYWLKFISYNLGIGFCL
jgi:Outer membrane protein beta-barrel domain